LPYSNAEKGEKISPGIGTVPGTYAGSRMGEASLGERHSGRPGRESVGEDSAVLKFDRRGDDVGAAEKEKKGLLLRSVGGGSREGERDLWAGVGYERILGTFEN